ncbi:hypothetical protein CHS0354_024660 [Potamilus streckersoni]|uniref:Uncharacterized protein n=1 Tax=Potamilus streckersoni TaxID=2493646 RepID=A0AAE0SWG3_9BIVA|nr:hypothetical protein CHS0354_024660 [Potamilus streckersoni]
MYLLGLARQKTPQHIHKYSILLVFSSQSTLHRTEKPELRKSCLNFLCAEIYTIIFKQLLIYFLHSPQPCPYDVVTLSVSFKTFNSWMDDKMPQFSSALEKKNRQTACQNDMGRHMSC